MRTSNPVLRPNTFSTFDEVDKTDQSMSIEGTVNKIFILLAVLVIAAIPTWKLGASTHPEIVLMTTSPMLIGIFGSLIVALVIIIIEFADPTNELGQRRSRLLKISSIVLPFYLKPDLMFN